MDDFWELYERPHDPAKPVVCLNEKPCQLTADVRPPLPAVPDVVTKQDYEYERRGTCCVFAAVEAKAKRRKIRGEKQRKKADFARVARDLLLGYSEACELHLVLDNLNTHGPHSLRETFGDRRAAALLTRLEWHDSPKHDSWLNTAEIEIGVLDRQCLARRLQSQDVFNRETRCRSRGRNRLRCGSYGTLRHDDARRAFPKLYKRKLAG